MYVLCSALLTRLIILSFSRSGSPRSVFEGWAKNVSPRERKRRRRRVEEVGLLKGAVVVLALTQSYVGRFDREGKGRIEAPIGLWQ